MARKFDVQAAGREAVRAARAAVGARLESAVLYGSAAAGTFDAADSDLNVAFVLATLERSALDDLRAARSAWQRCRLVRPLLLTRKILAESRDTFPLEYLLIREFHVPLEGEDPFAGLVIGRPALRLQVERTLRTQALGLAWSYLDATETPAAARQWAARAGTAIAASVSGLLDLVGEAIPAARADLAARVAGRFGVSEKALRDVLVPPAQRPQVEATILFGEAQECLQRLLDAAERLDVTPESVSTRGG